MSYTIIIPFHSNLRLLQICVQSLLATTPSEVEILIIANNADRAQIDIPHFDERCRVYRFEQELFYPKAINIGADLAHGSCLIFCDADTYYTKGWFEALTSFWSNSTECGLCSSKLINPNNSNIIDFGIGFTQFNCPHPYKGRPHTFSLTLDNIEVQAACTANSIISRKLFQDIGGLNETLVHSYSDIDLCLRLREKGYHNYCISKSLVYHKGTSTIGSTMSSALKSDTKGVYGKLCGSKILIDMDVYFKRACEYLHQISYPIQSGYYYIDFSTIADKCWHHDMIIDLLNTKCLELYEKPHFNRDAPHISLYENIDSNIRNLNCPLLFFVDDFCSLKSNSIWSMLRNTEYDLIVDRNANMLPFSEIYSA